MGAADRRGDPHRRLAPTSTSSMRPRRARHWRPRLPGPGDPRHRGQLPAGRAGRGWPRSPAGRLVEIQGGGHLPHARHPVLVNTLVKEFVDMHTTILPRPSTPWLFARERQRRALGSVRRSAWATCCATWPSPGPCASGCRTWRSSGSRSRRSPTSWPRTARSCTRPAPSWPRSRRTGRASPPHHDLHAFYAFRRMDEILCANYMLFDDVVRDTPYDLWVGDESWEVDHFLHENPERKIAPYAFLTDVVGFLPVDPEGDPREAELCADYNAEMIEHRERFPLRARPVRVHRRLRRAADAPLGPGCRPCESSRERRFDQRSLRRAVRPGAYRPAARPRRGSATARCPLYLAAVGGTAVGRRPARADRRGVRAACARRSRTRGW